VDIVTLTLVFSLWVVGFIGIKGSSRSASMTDLFLDLEKACLEILQATAGDRINLFGVRVNGNLDGFLWGVVVHLDDLSGLLCNHIVPEVFDTSGTVQKNNNLEVAWFIRVCIDIVAAIALAFAFLDLAVGTTDFPHLVFCPSLGGCTSNYYE